MFMHFLALQIAISYILRISSFRYTNFHYKLINKYSYLFTPTNLFRNGKLFANENEKISNVGHKEKKLYLLSPRGFCEGVNRAINIVNECLRILPPPIYVKHEIVHNEIVCNALRAKGAIFVDHLEQVPEGAVLIFSAHGVSPAIRQQANSLKLVTIDASCPLVNKVHVYVKLKASEGYKIVLIGHKNHVETIGTYGEAPEATTVVETVGDVQNLNYTESDKLFYVTQTTLSLDDCKDICNALKKRYPYIETIPSGSICYATTNRQTAVQQISPLVDLVIVVGSQMSSNANRLIDTCTRRNVRGVLINSIEQLKEINMSNCLNIAVTSSASTPDAITQSVVDILTAEPHNYKLELYNAVEERIPKWKFPKNLQDMIKNSQIQSL